MEPEPADEPELVAVPEPLDVLGAAVPAPGDAGPVFGALTGCGAAGREPCETLGDFGPALCVVADEIAEVVVEALITGALTVGEAARRTVCADRDRPPWRRGIALWCALVGCRTGLSGSRATYRAA